MFVMSPSPTGPRYSNDGGDDDDDDDDNEHDDCGDDDDSHDHVPMSVWCFLYFS